MNYLRKGATNYPSANNEALLRNFEKFLKVRKSGYCRFIAGYLIGLIKKETPQDKEKRIENEKVYQEYISLYSSLYGKPNCQDRNEVTKMCLWILVASKLPLDAELYSINIHSDNVFPEAPKSLWSTDNDINASMVPITVHPCPCPWEQPTIGLYEFSPSGRCGHYEIIGEYPFQLKWVNGDDATDDNDVDADDRNNGEEQHEEFHPTRVEDHLMKTSRYRYALVRYNEDGLIYIETMTDEEVMDQLKVSKAELELIRCALRHYNDDGQ